MLQYLSAARADLLDQYRFGAIFSKRSKVVKNIVDSRAR